MRANIIDPAPRRPYNPVSIWKCKFCNEPDQSTEHYVRSCAAIKEEIFGRWEREYVFRIIQTLECDENTFFEITGILTKIYQLVNQ